MPWIPTLISVVASAALGWEGSICIVMGTPLLLVLSSFGGILGAIPRVRRPGLTAVAVCLPLAMSPLEQQVPMPQEPRTVRTAIDIHAPAATIWREIVAVPSIQPEERRWALFTALGFPAPIAAEIDRPGVGGVRQASFERGLLFVETVTEWKELETLSFTIDPRTDVIPPSTLDRHVTIGGTYFDVLEGTYRIEPRGSDRSRLLLSSRTRVSTHFNAYAGLWSDAIMRSIQVNILEVIRARAELRARTIGRAEGT
jgi:hypothetical protein